MKPAHANTMPTRVSISRGGQQVQISTPAAMAAIMSTITAQASPILRNAKRLILLRMASKSATGAGWPFHSALISISFLIPA